MPTTPSLTQQLLAAALPIASSFLTSRLLRNQSPVIQGLGTAAAGVLTNAAARRFGLPALDLPSLTRNPTLTGLPRGFEQFGGAAALIAGLRDQPTVEIPDFASFATPAGTAAKGFLQRGFEAPADPFAPGGIYEQYLPLLSRQEEDLRRAFETRLSRAFPPDVSLLAQGPVQRSARRLEEEFLQSRQKLIADLARENLERQRLMATSLAGIERTGQEASFEAALNAAILSAEAERDRNARLAQLGLTLLTDQSGNQQIVNVGDGGNVLYDQQGRPVGTVTDDGSVIPIGQEAGLYEELLQAAGGRQLLNPASASQLAQLLLTPEGQARALELVGPSIGRLLLPQGPGGPVAVDVLSNLIAAPGQSFLYTSPTGATALVSPGEAALLQAQGAGRITAAGSRVGGVLGRQFSAGAAGQALALGGTALGSGIVGYQVGRRVGDAIERPSSSATTFKTTAGGAVSGAAAGAATGGLLLDGPGALIGAFIGGIAGGIGGAGAERRRESAQRKAEAEATGRNRPVALQLVNQLATNASNLPSAQQTASQIEPIIQQLIDSGDPVVRQLIADLRALHPESGNSPFQSPSGAQLSPEQQDSPPASSFLQRLVRTAFDTDPGFEANKSNPESVMGRLLSEETGKFNTAFETVQAWTQRMEQGRALWESLMQYLGVA